MFPYININQWLVINHLSTSLHVTMYIVDNFSTCKFKLKCSGRFNSYREISEPCAKNSSIPPLETHVRTCSYGVLWFGDIREFFAF